MNATSRRSRPAGLTMAGNGSIPSARTRPAGARASRTTTGRRRRLPRSGRAPARGARRSCPTRDAAAGAAVTEPCAASAPGGSASRAPPSRPLPRLRASAPHSSAPLEPSPTRSSPRRRSGARSRSPAAAPSVTCTPPRAGPARAAYERVGLQAGPHRHVGGAARRADDPRRRDQRARRAAPLAGVQRSTHRARLPARGEPTGSPSPVRA